MAGQKAADRWRQLHAPGGKTDEYPVELLQVVDAGSERRQIAAFILLLHLCYGGTIIFRVGLLQLQCHHLAAGFRLDHACHGLGVVAAAQVDDQIFGKG